jgi:hypothetical protein
MCTVKTDSFDKRLRSCRECVICEIGDYDCYLKDWTQSKNPSHVNTGQCVGLDE